MAAEKGSFFPSNPTGPIGCSRRQGDILGPMGSGCWPWVVGFGVGLRPAAAAAAAVPPAGAVPRAAPVGAKSKKRGKRENKQRHTAHCNRCMKRASQRLATTASLSSTRPAVVVVALRARPIPAPLVSLTLAVLSARKQFADYSAYWLLIGFLGCCHTAAVATTTSVAAVTFSSAGHLMSANWRTFSN